ncbi:nitroreductase family protein [Streptococcus suis]|uniref:nitroreductase family protein n=1 Tax=Streptococcus suis TaxID=1307 RepID=UPI001AD8782F|nr:nitroreductase family protein [Streptococcus suis]MBO8082326.1 NADPH-dependent oxidoreductase [Streptococcus suis]MCG9861178.1 nitroreductase family protein [Streptococcus suis]MCK3877449.1 NADPH-dependent oxidoreductase [Streptococcus suis]MCK3929374.1 NADPH-dependent oxidoreductase [Streptococcus suis]MCK3980477.1 NADPH-dependent oxidoreductase [Streptococcus suis]
MNETIDLMLNHTSVRRFTEEPIEAEHLQAIISAGRAASSWKNFQSYSIIVVQLEEKKQALYDLVPQPAILQAQAILVFVGDHNRASKAAQLHGSDFDAKGTENLLISSVDASLAGQNALLASEAIVFQEEYVEQGVDVIEAYDQVQTDYAGARQTETWSERMVAQFGQPEQPETKSILEKNKLL